MSQPISMQKNIHPSPLKELPINQLPKQHDSFSRPRHFAMVLVPMFLAVAGLLVYTYFAASPLYSYLEKIYGEGLKTYLVQDTSAGFGLFIYGMFVLGVGYALWMQHRVGKLLGWDKE